MEMTELQSYILFCYIKAELGQVGGHEFDLSTHFSLSVYWTIVHQNCDMCYC